MAESGITAEVNIDIASYKTPMSIMGVNMSKRLVVSIAIAAAVMALVSLVLFLAFGITADNLMVLYMMVALGVAVVSMRDHRGLMPEQYLPYMIPRKVKGHRLVRVSDDAQQGAIPKPNDGIKRTAEYKKALSKRGLRTPETYLPRLYEAMCEANEEQEGCEVSDR